MKKNKSSKIITDEKRMNEKNTKSSRNERFNEQKSKLKNNN